MKPETALQLLDRLNREIVGLKKVIEQLTQPDTGTTMAGLKSGLTIVSRALLRTNQIVHDIIRTEVEPPVGRNSRDALAAFNDIFRK